MSLDKTWNDAVQFLEKLGGKRCGEILMDFRRTENNRREAMAKNKSPVIYVIVDVCVRKQPGDVFCRETNTSEWMWFKAMNADPCAAIDDAMTQLKLFLNPPEHERVWTPPIGAEDLA